MAFCLLEFVQPPGEWTPLHVHKRSDQTHYVLEGEVALYLPGESVVVGPGECSSAPMNVPHTENVTSDQPARVLVLNSPAGFDEFVAAAGQPATELTLPPPAQPPPDIERLAAIAAQHGVEILGLPERCRQESSRDRPGSARSLHHTMPGRIQPLLRVLAGSDY